MNQLRTIRPQNDSLTGWLMVKCTKVFCRTLWINPVCWPLAVMIISHFQKFIYPWKKTTGTPVGSSRITPWSSSKYRKSKSYYCMLILRAIKCVNRVIGVVWLDKLPTNNVLVLYHKANIEIKSATPMRTIMTWSTFTNKDIYVFSYACVFVYIWTKNHCIIAFVRVCVYSHITISIYYRLK